MTAMWDLLAALKFGTGAAAGAVAGAASTLAAIGLGLGGWLVAAWLITAVLVARGAAGRGRSALAWFLLAILLAPPVAALMLLVVPDRAERRQRDRALLGKDGLRLCPSCAEVVRQEARCCRYCGVDLQRLDQERERQAGGARIAGGAGPRLPSPQGRGPRPGDRRAEPMISS